MTVMTREKAISALRRYKRTAYRCNDTLVIFPMKRSSYWITCVYGQYLVDALIGRIRNSSLDPIEVVGQLYSDLDTVLGESDDDHFETHQFASIMEYEAGNIMRYLKGEG